MADSRGRASRSMMWIHCGLRYVEVNGSSHSPLLITLHCPYPLHRHRTRANGISGHRHAAIQLVGTHTYLFLSLSPFLDPRKRINQAAQAARGSFSPHFSCGQSQAMLHHAPLRFILPFLLSPMARLSSVNNQLSPWHFMAYQDDCRPNFD
jgi:hypothetical protein